MESLRMKLSFVEQLQKDDLKSGCFVVISVPQMYDYPSFIPCDFLPLQLVILCHS